MDMMDKNEIESLIQSIEEEENPLLLDALRDIKDSVQSDKMKAIMAFALSQLLSLRRMVLELREEVNELKEKYVDFEDHLNDLDLTVEEAYANIDELEKNIKDLR